ncbi:hypothetical protein ABFA25_05590 [Mycobacterium lepromatosis]
MLGAAVLIAPCTVDGGWSTAVGVFLLTGVLLQLCPTSLRGLAAHPLQVAPIQLHWLVFTRFAPR